MASTAREVAERYTESINAHDPDAIAALYAEKAGLEEPAGTFMGRQTMAEYWERFFNAFPDLTVRDQVLVDTGDVAFAEWTCIGTNSGPLETPEGTLPPTGKRVAIRGCDIVTVRDGLVQEHRAYYDQLSLFSQLGLVPEPALS